MPSHWGRSSKSPARIEIQSGDSERIPQPASPPMSWQLTHTGRPHESTYKGAMLLHPDGPENMKPDCDGASSGRPRLSRSALPAHPPGVGSWLVSGCLGMRRSGFRRNREEATHGPFSRYTFPSEAGLTWGELMPKSEFRLVSETDMLISELRLCVS